MKHVNVKPELMMWAINRAGGMKKIQEKVPNVEKWITLEKFPTLKQLEKLAKTTSTPLGYFFLKEPPKEEVNVPYYRTFDTLEEEQMSVELLDTLKIMEMRQEWMKDYRIDNGREPLPFVGSVKMRDGITKVAKTIREMLGLEEEWASSYSTWTEALRQLMYILEDHGVLVMANGVVGNNTHRPLNVNEFRGFVLIDSYAPLVFLNSKDGKAAQLFTLAHEIAHLWFGKNGIFNLKELQPSENELEQKCNQVAAEFLVPAHLMKGAWEENKNEEDRYQRIARRFKVSELVIVKRALDLQFITYADYKAYYQKRQVDDIKKDRATSGGDYYNNQNVRIGRPFGEAIITSTLQGRTLYRDAYRLTGLTSKTFQEYVNRQDRGRRSLI